MGESNLREDLISIAICCLNYSEVLKIKDHEISSALGIIYRKYQAQIADLSRQQLALMATYLSNIKEEYYSFYFKLFDKNILDYVMRKSATALDQFHFLNFIEDFYFEFFSDFECSLYPIISKISISDVLERDIVGDTDVVV